MKVFSFKVSHPNNSTRMHQFYEEQRAKNKRAEYADMDPRFNPSELSSEALESGAVVVDKNNKHVEHDITGLVFVGTRRAQVAGSLRDEEWYAYPGTENDVKKELVKAKRQPNTAYERKKNGKGYDADFIPS